MSLTERGRIDHDKKRNISVLYVNQVSYPGSRAVRLRRYDTVSKNRLFLTARNGGLTIFDISQPENPIRVFATNDDETDDGRMGRGEMYARRGRSTPASTMECFEGQDMSPDGRYFAVASPCSGEIRVYDMTNGIRNSSSIEDVPVVVASVVLWPTSSALHVRWMLQPSDGPSHEEEGGDEDGATRHSRRSSSRRSHTQNLVVSNPGRLWDAVQNRWIDEVPSEIEDGIIVLRFEKVEEDTEISLSASTSSRYSLRIVGHVSPGNVNGTESITLLRPEPFLLIGGFRSNDLDLIDITDAEKPRLVESVSDPSYRQMVGAYEDGFAYLGMWGTPGGLAIFAVQDEKNPKKAHTTKTKTIQHISSLLSDELSSTNRVKLAYRSALAVLPLETPRGGAFGIVDISNVFNLSMACDVVDIQGAGENDTTYALELDSTESYIYVAPTDGTLRIYSLGVDFSLGV